MPNRSDKDLSDFAIAIATNNTDFLEKWNNESNLERINIQLSEILNLMSKNQIRLESFFSNILETEMVTQDQYDKLIELLIDYGKKRGWK